MALGDIKSIEAKMSRKELIIQLSKLVLALTIIIELAIIITKL